MRGTLTKLISRPQLYWQIVDKSIRLLTNFTLGILVAKQFGNEAYGLYSFAITVLLLFMSVSTFGIPNFLTSEVAKGYRNDSVILPVFVWLKLGLSLIVFMAYMISGYVFNETNEYYWLLGVCILSQVFEVFEFYNVGKSNITKNLKAKSVVGIVGFVMKLAFIYDGQIGAVYLLYVIEYVVISLVAFQSSRSIEHVIERVDWHYALSVVKQLVPLSITSFAALMTTKIDQIVLKLNFNYETMGEYNLLLLQTSIWTVFPVMLANYYLPIIAKNSRLLNIDDFSFFKAKIYSHFKWLGVIVSLFPILTLPFYTKYLVNIESSATMIAGTILPFSNYFVSIAMYQSILMVVENLHYPMLTKTLSSMLLLSVIMYTTTKFIGVMALPLSIILVFCYSEFFLPRLFGYTHKIIRISNEKIY